MRILIVDDDELVAKLLGQVCRSEGHETRTTTSPERALETLFERPIDVLITDLAMPGLDGVSLMRHARRLQPSIFTLIITGHARDFALDEVMKEGYTDVMFKPFHMNELRARLALATHHKKALDAMETGQGKAGNAADQDGRVAIDVVTRPKAR